MIQVAQLKELDRRSKALCSTIYVKFDDSKAGNSLKDRRLRGELKEWVPITARTKMFPTKKETVLRKHYDLYARWLKSIHQQENCTGEELSTTYISRVKFTPYFSVPKVVIYWNLLFFSLNFEHEDIKVNEFDVEEMIQMIIISQAETLNRIEWHYYMFNQYKVMEWSLRTFSHWSDILKFSSLLCFTKKNVSDSTAKHIDENLDEKDIHKNTQHCLALSYNVSKLNIKVIDKIPSVLEVLPIVLEIETDFDRWWF